MKRSMEVRWAELRVGLFLVAALVLFGFGLFLVGQRTRLFIPTTEVRVVLTDVQGLRVGAPVWLSGVVIGSVEDIVFAVPLKSEEIIVVLRLEESAARRLGSDAKVSIRTRGLLGEKYVDISPGTETGVPQEPLRGLPPMGMDQVLSQAYGAFERFDRLTAQLEKGEGSFAKLLQDPSLYDSLNGLAQKMRSLLDAVDRGEGTLGKLVHDPGLYREMVSVSERGVETMQRLDALIASLDRPDGTLGKLAREPQLHDESLAAIREFRRTMTDLDALLGDIHQGEGTVGRLVKDAELHDRLLKTLGDLDALISDIRKNPDRYVRFSLF